MDYGMGHITSAMSMIYIFGFGVPVLSTLLLRIFGANVEYSIVKT